MTSRFDIFAERIYSVAVDENNATKMAQATKSARLSAGLNTRTEMYDYLVTKNSNVFLNEVNEWLISFGMVTEYDVRNDLIHAVLYEEPTPENHLMPKITGFINVFNKNAHFEFFGDPAKTIEMKELISSQWSENSCKVYKSHLDKDGRNITTRVSIIKDETTTPYDCFYPFMEKSLDTYYNDYFESKESLLLLIGAPGTGKSTWLRGMCFKRGEQTLLCNDAAAIESGEIFRYFSSADFDLLIIEDADQFLIPREDGNSMMSTLLNEADGIVKQPQKKIVISTNLSSVNKVDTGLVRPGRCYDVLKFEPLNAEEIRAIEIERQLNPCQSVATATLSEVLNYKTQAETKHKAVKLGFTS